MTGLVPAALDERSEQLQRSVAAIDRANADDPHTITVGGVERPKEQAHAELACQWVLHLDPGATDEQLLAARAHHLRRWEVPRTDYPEGRSGYLRWRADQKKRHAAAVREILRAEGYPDASVDRVGAIVGKEGLRTDPQVQTHEDALCLVFLQTQFDGVTDQLGDDKMVEVLVKTMGKMSPAGLAAAGALDLDGRGAALLAEASGRLASP